MLRVLLVDDEPLELQALRDHVNWNDLGVGEVLAAKNGRIAYEMVLEQEPDIVITDVHMPVMDGIMLARKIYELNRRIKVVFLSGYDDFTYVKSAMQMGAVDYLLKPFTQKSVAEVILKVKELLEKERLFSQSLEALERQLLERLCTGNEAEQSFLLGELSRIKRAESVTDTYGMLLFFGVSGKSLSDSLLKNMPEIHAAWVDENRLAVILRGYTEPEEAGIRIRSLLQKLTGLLYSGVYLDRRCLKAEELSDGYRILKTWGTFIYYRHAGCLKGVREEESASLPSHFTPPHEVSEPLMEECLSRLEKLFPYENEELTTAGVDHLIQAFQDRRLPRSAAESNLRRFCQLLERRLQATFGGMQKLTFDPRKLEACRYAEELRTLLLDSLRRMSVMNQERENGKNAYVVRRVKEYVQQHYGEPMTVDAIADEIHLSVNYVRSIFKDGTGQTILEYVTDYRFAKACELLKNPALRIREVANMVGYENISYFGSVFTKRYRMTPNEYRRQFL